ncbi:hypothetical protein GQ457_09G009180 [Hibiscus cannabinus]
MVSQWQVPHKGWCTLNTDGSRVASTRFATCGRVLQNHVGDWLLGFYRKVGVYSVLEAELWGVAEGLRYRGILFRTRRELVAFMGWFVLVKFVGQLNGHGWNGKLGSEFLCFILAI